MTKHDLYLTVHLLILIFGFQALSSCNKIEQPNIIVIFTDDQGFADVGAYGIVKDVRTPNIDKLAADGIRMTSGYVTAPQCTPSRAGLISGRYQQKFGLDGNIDGPLHSEEITIAERLQEVGYATGMVGKWHLDPNKSSKKWLKNNMPNFQKSSIGKIPFGKKVKYTPMNQGFTDVWWGTMNNYTTNYSLDGTRFQNLKNINDKRFRIDVQTDAALTFIDTNKEKPFFLYLSYFAPHVPLGANEKYLSRFSEDMPIRRRYGLAMISAMDDGVGKIREKLSELKLTENTIIFFVSDNGAPLELSKIDRPNINKASATWNGSLNDPWIGEKGMLTEGGIRIPFIVSWPGTLPAAKVFDKPVSALDIGATSVELAEAKSDDLLDGVNLIPYLKNDIHSNPHEYLYWRFGHQGAIRHKNWKYLYLSDGKEYLFDVTSDQHENQNLIQKNMQVATKLKGELSLWASKLENPKLPVGPLSLQEQRWYDYFIKDEERSDYEFISTQNESEDDVF